MFHPVAKLLVVITLILSLLGLPSTALAAGLPVYAKAIQPLQFIDEQGVAQTFCTGFSVNKSKGYYGTNRHCALAALKKQYDGYRFVVGGKPADVLAISQEWDLAVIVSERHEPALKFDWAPMERGDAIEVFGFPWGFGPALTFGHVAALGIPIQGYHTSDILDVTIAPGNSGSPVTKNGRIVAVIWGRFTESNHALSVPQKAVVAFFKPYI